MTVPSTVVFSTVGVPPAAGVVSHVLWYAPSASDGAYRLLLSAVVTMPLPTVTPWTCAGIGATATSRSTEPLPVWAIRYTPQSTSPSETDRSAPATRADPSGAWTIWWAANSMTSVGSASGVPVGTAHRGWPR